MGVSRKLRLHPSRSSRAMRTAAEFLDEIKLECQRVCSQLSLTNGVASKCPAASLPVCSHLSRQSLPHRRVTTHVNAATSGLIETGLAPDMAAAASARKTQAHSFSNLRVSAIPLHQSYR